LILSAGQPYFAPYPGFFEKILASDVFVVLDAVQFPRGTTWLSRNRFKNDRGTLWLTAPVRKKGLGLQPIDKVRLLPDDRWRHKHLAALKSAYARAPWFADHLPWLTDLLSGRHEHLLELNMAVISHLAAHFGITTRIVRQTALGTSNTGPALLVEICRKVGADTFLAQQPAAKYLDPMAFDRADLGLRFFRPGLAVYPQLWGAFVPNLSSLDMLFNCGPRSAEILSQRRYRQEH